VTFSGAFRAHDRNGAAGGVGDVMTKRVKRTYTDDFRAGCLLQVEAGGSIKAVARKNKVPRSTLRSWLNRAQALQKQPQGASVPANIYAEKKLDLVALIESELGAIFGDMGHTRQDAGYRELGTVAGILFDKRQLLTGGPTSNVNEKKVVFVSRIGNGHDRD
jgi:transposase-like protein